MPPVTPVGFDSSGVESGGHEHGGTAEFLRVVVAHLRGTTIGVRTELVVSGAPDKGDLDPVAVSSLPPQDRGLDAFGALGFRFRGADVEAGRIQGAHPRPARRALLL